MTHFPSLTIIKIISYQTPEKRKECRLLNRNWYQTIDHQVKYLHFYNHYGQQRQGVYREGHYIVSPEDFDPQNISLQVKRLRNQKSSISMKYYHRYLVFQIKTLTAPFGIQKGWANLKFFISLTFDPDDYQSRKFKNQLDQLDQIIREKAPDVSSSFIKKNPIRSDDPDLYTCQFGPSAEIFQGFQNPLLISSGQEIDSQTIPPKSRCKVLLYPYLININDRSFSRLKIIQLAFEPPQRNDLFDNTFTDF